eukprot:TRINITY_DN710_c0_g2_i1.p1 TRINITY_DN710_c0_g2~~TRINITY_DN710_c0_g2_i1.p1  ORF type:complete len:302 (+),score=58.03 TRINITY_DN710_c0_g2_i1:93-908(+)
MSFVTVLAVTPDNERYEIDISETDDYMEFCDKVERATGVPKDRMELEVEECEYTGMQMGEEFKVNKRKGLPKEEAIRQLKERGITNIGAAKMIGEIEAGRNYNVELLYYAGAACADVVQYAACHCLEALELLVLLGIDVDVCENSFLNRTALHHASRLGSTESIELLVQFGANINRLDKNGLTPLQVAIIESSSVPSMTLLVNLGADLALPDLIGRTPLHNAILYGTTGTVPELLRLGANPSQKDNTGRNPFSVALKSFNIRSAWLLRYCC